MTTNGVTGGISDELAVGHGRRDAHGAHGRGGYLLVSYHHRSGGGTRDYSTCQLITYVPAVWI